MAGLGLDTRGLVQAALGALTAADVAQALAGFPAGWRRKVLAEVGLRPGKRPPLKSAETVLRHLRNGHPAKRSLLAAALCGLVLHIFENHDGLTVADCAALLDQATAADVLGRTDVLGHVLHLHHEATPKSLLHLALTHVLQSDLCLSLLAIGLLQADADQFGPEHAASLREAWRRLRAGEQALPEKPISLSALCELAAGSGAHDANEEVSTLPQQPETTTLHTRLDDVRERFVTAAEAAEAIRASLQAGQRPSQADLTAINGVVQDFDEVRASLAALGAETTELAELVEPTLDDLARALETAAEQNERVRRIRALTGLRGPSPLEAQLAEIREAAVAGDDEGLAALGELIEICDHPDVDYEAIDRLKTTAQELLPQWKHVVIAASLARVTVDPSAKAADGAPAASVQPQAEDVRPEAPELDDLDELLAADAASRTPTQQAPAPSATREGEQATGGEKPTTTGGAPANDGKPSSGPDEKNGTSQAPEADTEAATLVQVEAGEPGEGTAGTEAEVLDAEVVDAAVLEAEAAALRSGRVALAGWIRGAGGRPEVEVRARRAAAIAPAITQFDGRMAAAYAETVRGLDSGALGADPAGRLLVWASAIRAGIVRPAEETADLLRWHAGIVAGRPGLTALGRMFLDAIAEGVCLLPGVSNELRGALRAEERQARAAEEARRTLREGPLKKIKYQAATEVWKQLLLEEGVLGRLLSVAAADAVDRAGEAGRGLADAQHIDRLIDGTAKAIRARHRIEAKARQRLAEHIAEALDVVAEWTKAVAAVKAFRATESKHQWMTERLASLRREAAAHREQLLAELTETADAAGPAAHAARRLLIEALELLNGAPLGPEPQTAGQVIHKDLLAIPGVAVKPGSYEPVAPPTLDGLVTIATTEEIDWTAAFEARTARGDHVGTQAIVHLLTRTDPDLAADLAARRATLVAQVREDHAAKVEKLRDHLARLRHDGVLEEHEAAGLERRLAPLADPERDDFDQMSALIDATEREAADIAEAQLGKARQELAECADRPAVTAAHDRIRECLDRGDLTLAREFLAQAKAGRDLPEPPSGRGHLARFFPAFPDAFDAIQAARRSETCPALTLLINALRRGGQIEDTLLHETVTTAGLDLTTPRRDGMGRDALRNWRKAAEGPKPAGNLTTLIEPILRLIGLDGTQRAGAAARNRTWIELNQVRWRGPALLPQLGSRMSPAGNTLRLLLLWKRPQPEEIIELLKEEPPDQTVLVWYFGTLPVSGRRRLVAATRRRRHPVAVLDDAALGYLACLPRPDWTATVGTLAPFTSINPFIPIGDVPEEMFYGRDEQLQQVLDRSGGSFVYGGRQLGKSALLHAARRGPAGSDRVVVFQSIYEVGRTAPAEAIWAKLRRPLTDAGILPQALPGTAGPEPIQQAIKDWLGGGAQRQLLILLDETDEFLNRDAEGARFANVGKLSGLMSETERRVKVVFAGLHQTARFKSLPNQPLAHFGMPISIGPLRPQPAYDLLTRPLAALGYHLPETSAARIIAQANNAPALIQLFADALLEYLWRPRAGERTLPPYEVTPEDVAKVWDDAKLAQGFRDRFDWTINLDPRYKVIAHMVAFKALTEGTDTAIPAGELFDGCRDWWARGFAACSRDAFQGLLEESVELGILAAEDGRYRLRTPYILELLGGADQVQASLAAADEFEPPDSFDVHSYRGAYRTGPDRSPLTGGQVAHLLRPANLVCVVAGSAALQLERVAEALSAEQERLEGVRVTRVRQDGITFERAAEQARTGRHLVVADLRGRTLKQAFEQVKQATQVVSRHREGTLGIVFTTPPDLAPLWLAATESGRHDGSYERLAGVELMELLRLGPVTVRQWMREESHAFQDPDGQRRLLAATGGWPSLISTVLGSEIVADTEAGLGRCRRSLSERPGAFLADAGLYCCPPVTVAWRALVDIDAPGEVTDLIDLLTPGDTDDHPLATDQLRRYGYRTVADVIEVLRILGALEQASGDGRELGCEPVLAEATRAAGELA